MSYSSIILDFHDTAVALVSLNRPESANALNTAMALELKDFFTSSIPAKTIVLSGMGKNFCAGADLKERTGMDENAWKMQHEAFRAARDAILNCPLPVIAAVNGAAFAGGLELALVCDFIYAASDARFALTESTLGIMPGMGGTQTLPRSVGKSRAKEILLTGKPFTAKEAMEWGMVNKLCSPETLLNETISTAKIIAENAPLSIKAIKKSVDRGFDISLEDGLKEELSHYNTLLKSRDRHEGINAWAEKRKPVFKNE